MDIHVTTICINVFSKRNKKGNENEISRSLINKLLPATEQHVTCKGYSRNQLASSFNCNRHKMFCCFFFKKKNTLKFQIDPKKRCFKSFQCVRRDSRFLRNFKINVNGEPILYDTLVNMSTC